MCIISFLKSPGTFSPTSSSSFWNAADADFLLDYRFFGPIIKLRMEERFGASSGCWYSSDCYHKNP
jgi:hypothetical protein